MTKPIFIRISDIRSTYGISRDTVYRAINAGKLELHKLGRASLIRCEDLENLITGGETTKEQVGG